jgi:hypothetical protein
MGLFSFFNGKQQDKVTEISNRAADVILPDIPEDIFVEKEKPKNDEPLNRFIVPLESGISALFDFIEKNYEGKGYDDALINPDSVHLEQNIQALKNDLERTIKKIRTFYEDFIREINFHIETRSRIGMVDTVEELTVKKQTAEDHIKQIVEIERDAAQNQGIGFGIVISYRRGFNNGLAAISHHSIMKRNF